MTEKFLHERVMMQIDQRKIERHFLSFSEKTLKYGENKTVSDVIIEMLEERSKQKRLRDRFISYVVLALLLNCYVFWMSKNGISIMLLGMGIMFGIIGGWGIYYLEQRHTAKRIFNNIYKETPNKNLYQALQILIGFCITFLLYKTNMPNDLFNQLVAIPVAFSFLICSLLMLGWLIDYEKKNGPVYIISGDHGVSSDKY